ncbi:oryzain alpha chain-like [Planoprotostelium fungivorum]|uniref:Oryzain alpha chain-like n=1 Tax=Planoprotostelium fungivorum TaxID=1890364 RepID=A0A2P6NQW3_9EUKA|nr:oryzain alpha chain-like [Planoprotostelium fungivorum]
MNTPGGDRRSHPVAFVKCQNSLVAFHRDQLRPPSFHCHSKMNKTLIVLSLLACATAWTLKVQNRVAPCPGRNYPTIKLFYSDYGQQDTWQGQDIWVDSSRIGFLGLGIQENGMYCRSHGNEGGCINPDNAGAQLVVNQGNCHSIQWNDPFYCGRYPPNAKGVIDVWMDGQWPNCVATFTRKGNAPGCASWRFSSRYAVVVSKWSSCQNFARHPSVLLFGCGEPFPNADAMRKLTFLSLLSFCLFFAGAKPSQHDNDVKRADSPIDWRDRKVLGQVGAQGQCNSDWAFALSSAMASCIAISISIDPIELSKQQLQDCTAGRKCLGSSVSVSDALEWIRTSGLSVDQDYPYTQSDGQCHNTAYRWSFTTVSTGSSEDEMSSLLAAGPVIVTYNGGALESYTGGVISNTTNSSSSIVDSVGLLVGWSSDCGSNNTQCWIIRTSKGSNWGESGHFRVEKGRGLMSLGAAHQPQKCYIMSLPGSYGYLEAVDRIGGEMNNDIIYPSLNSPDCQKLCYRDFQCNAWAFDTCNNKCYLKSKVPATTTIASCRMSGVITAPRVTSYDGAYGLIEKGDRPGSDLGDAIVALSADDCQGRCFGTPQCNAWAFDTCGNLCWMKGSSGALDTSITCRASGVITAKRNDRNGPYGPMEYTDRVGIDLTQTTAISAEDCQLQCFKHPQCLVWSFESCGKRCWLKQKSSGTESNNCRISGTITSKKGDRNTNLGPIEWVDRPGGDLSGSWTANSADDCQSQCNNHPQCTVWAYDACGNQCWLKQSTTGPENRSCRQSGTIAGKNGGSSGGTSGGGGGGSLSLKVQNRVAPCPGRNYATIKLFFTANAQQDIWQGQDVVIPSSRIGFLGLGIQENGMYCRSHGNEGGCINPDNAGAQLIVNQGNCRSIQWNDPFYCGRYPPNAKNVIDIAMDGQWPNCVVTLTRKGNAPGCASSC